MSTIIMNNMFNCADDCAVKIYYQDTYIIHLNYDDVDNMLNDINKHMTKSW